MIYECENCGFKYDAELPKMETSVDGKFTKIEIGTGKNMMIRPNDFTLYCTCPECQSVERVELEEVS